ncbi:AMP-binding protein [Micromonospora carbonacea]|uniref:Acyl-CoA synthetase (AMP-forming)/AMP-acid ligase II n=1 Tax=Micromonospora carbonacea TaxID=47853 RepID=A0A1C4YSY1_9ACTN|nr:class I adenylate-forming enzyme family protein [Micromonospora carbonacea]SCF23754.1 Acyl-CoA synthetase (AMP-forming)/AMP-acid ligase II [Micromonospora carbonacea]
MGDDAPWLRPVAELLARSDHGVVDESGRVPWRDIVGRARDLAAELPRTAHGWVVPADCTVRSLVGLLAIGLATPSPRWVLGDPARWGVGRAFHDVAWEAGAHSAPPDEVRGPTYATATSGSTGRPRLLFGRPHALHEAVRLYVEGMPEYGQAEVFAACSSLDFAAAFYVVMLPALLRGRDLLLFRPHQWALAGRHLADRPGICLAPPALATLTAGAAPAGARYDRTTFVPAGGGLTPDRARRISVGLPGCRFLTMLGSTETGLLTVRREVDATGNLGAPLPGKQVWLEDVGPDGVGMLWTRGPDTRFAAVGGELRARPDGAVSAGDLVRPAPDGTGYLLEGRVDDLIKVDGVTVYPASVAAAVQALPGVTDARVSVDRSGPVDRITVLAVGDVTEELVRSACAGLPSPVVPARVLIRASTEAAFNDRGKALL